MDVLQHGQAFGKEHGRVKRHGIDEAIRAKVRGKIQINVKVARRSKRRGVASELLGLRDDDSRRGLDGRWRRRGFARLEAARFVRTVAERLGLGLPAPAQRDVLFADRQHEFVAQMIDDLKLRGQHQWAILAETDGDFLFRHFVTP
jgi:hypothetical protein